MIEFCYDPVGIAYFIDSHNLGARSQMDLLERIYSKDAAFLRPDYRDDKKRLFSDTLYWVNYLVDKVTLDAEYPAIEKDFRQMGREISREGFLLSDYANVDLFFMSMRLQIRFTGIQNYVRKKMRTVLKSYGYKRRTAALMEHMRDCMMFYHIQTYLSGEQECDIREINLDDMITFRLI